MTTCRSCGSEITWITLITSKRHPCDPELVEMDELETGMRLVTLDGQIITADGKERSDEPRSGYVSHFSTCPQADSWRKSK